MMPVRIRIMHFVDALGQGGLENGLVNLIERLDPEVFEHVVCAIRDLGPNADRLPRHRVRVICLHEKTARLRLQVKSFINQIREVKPQIVHSRNWGAVEATLAGKWTGSAVVHSEHGLESDAGASEPWRRRVLRRLAFEVADQVVSVSDHLRCVHARRTGFDARRIAIIHNGVDSGRFRPDAQARIQVREELGIGPQDLCIGSVGNLLPVKDHMTLLRAFDTVARSLATCHLSLIGEGSERRQLEDFANAHPEWRKRVHFLGSSHRVREILNALDVYVVPSISEGICNSLLEAMATGLPVVATATGGNPEVIVDRDSGILFPVGDSGTLAQTLLDLIRARDLRMYLGERSLRRARESFSIDSMVRNYGQMYESLVPVVTSTARAFAGA